MQLQEARCDVRPRLALAAETEKDECKTGAGDARTECSQVCRKSFTDKPTFIQMISLICHIQPRDARWSLLAGSMCVWHHQLLGCGMLGSELAWCQSFALREQASALKHGYSYGDPTWNLYQSRPPRTTQCTTQHDTQITPPLVWALAQRQESHCIDALVSFASALIAHYTSASVSLSITSVISEEIASIERRIRSQHTARKDSLGKDSRSDTMMGTKRQREPHFIAGLGDGNVRKPLRNTNDDFFPPEDKQLTPYIRSGRTQKALRDARQIFNKDHFSGSGDGITATAATEGPWQISAMALLCVMGLLVGLFLHLVTDSAEKHPYPRRVRRTHSSPTKKKKTDEWSEDEKVDEDDYTADSEAHSLYYPYHPRYANQQQQHRHRARTGSSNNSGTLHHRMPANTYKGPSSSRHAGSSQSPGPALRPTRSIDSGTVLSTRGTRPVIEGVPSTDEDMTLSPWKAAPLNARPLSPVSSFASMGNQSINLSTHSGDEELGTPPPVVSQAASFDMLQQASSRDVLAGSEHEMETPRAGTRQTAAVFRERSKSPYVSSTLLPPPPEHEPLEPQDMARAKTPTMLPYIPFLDMDPSMNEVSPDRPLHSASSRGPDRVLRHSMSEPPAAAYPGHIQQRGTPPQELQRQASSPERQASASNDPRKNIIHKREDITHCTDAESSLMGSVDFSELTLDCVIGGGGFGQVWKATWRSTPVAVKILTGSAQREIVSKGILEEFAAEINMLKVSLLAFIWMCGYY